MFSIQISTIFKTNQMLLYLVLFLHIINVGQSLSERESLKDILTDDLNSADGTNTSTSHLLELSSQQLDISEGKSARVLERQKRQIFSYCPSKPADGSETGQSYLLFYSPNERQDVTIAYGGPREGWSGEVMKRLLRNGFKINRPTLIYTHGFMQSGKSKWLREVRKLYDDEFPNQDGTSKITPSFNLLFFDWSAYSRQSYKIAVSWVPGLGKVLGDFFIELADRYSYDLSKVHLVSFSLSTHIAGNAGRRASRKLGQITALDPTGVCMHHHGDGFAKKYALQASDAKLVVAEHYDMHGYGAKRSVGGLDIFVNGGKTQPGVRSKRETGNMSQLFVKNQFFSLANHNRAVEHQTQAEDGRCYEVAYACSSYSAFEAGECGSCGKRGENCYYMNNFGSVRFERIGVQVRSKDSYKPTTEMYIKTGPSKYCLHHYQVLVKLRPNSPTSVVKSLKSGQVTLKFDASDLQVKVEHRADSDKFTALVLQAERLRKSSKIATNLRSSSKIDEKEFGSSVEYIEMNYMSHAVPKERERLSSRYCWNSEEGAFSEC